MFHLNSELFHITEYKYYSLYLVCSNFRFTNTQVIKSYPNIRQITTRSSIKIKTNRVFIEKDESVHVYLHTEATRSAGAASLITSAHNPSPSEPPDDLRTSRLRENDLTDKWRRNRGTIDTCSSDRSVSLAVRLWMLTPLFMLSVKSSWFQLRTEPGAFSCHSSGPQ